MTLASEAVARCRIGELFPSSPRSRVVIKHQLKFSELDHHPVRSIKEASRHFIEVADTPPRRGGEKSGTAVGNTPF
jgi:hypothetical protein